MQLGDGASAATLNSSSGIANNGTFAVDQSGSTTLTPVISGMGTLVQMGAGTLVLTASNTCTGITIVNSGTLQVGNGGSGEYLASPTVYDNSVLSFDHSDALLYGGSIVGSGSVLKAGGGVLTLISSSSFSGSLTVVGGTLQLGDGAVGHDPTLQIGGIINNAGLVYNVANAATAGYGISGSGGLNKIGPGTLTMTGPNTYQGPTKIAAGIVSLGVVTSAMQLNFNGNSTDSSANNNNATLVNGPIYTHGIQGQALTLNGSSQYAAVPYSPSLGLAGRLRFRFGKAARLSTALWAAAVRRSSALAMAAKTVSTFK